MIIRKTFKAAALASVCLLPLIAVAQAADDTGFDLPEAMPNTQELNRISSQPSEAYDNEATIGLRGQSSTSAAFGRYNGDYREGASIIGGFQLRGRSDWKSTDTYYYNLNGKDLKLGFGGAYDIAPNSSVSLKVGNQGTWGLTADYDAMSYVQSNSFTTIFDKNGTLVNAPGALGSNGTAGVVTRNGYATDLVGTRRDKGSVGLKYFLGDWTLTSGLVHEHKEGTQESSMLVGGGNANGIATLPLPINYDTDRFTAGAAFATPKLQANLAYTFSSFKDNTSGFLYQAYETQKTVGEPMVGVYSTPPSNMAHQLAGQLGYNLTDTTRLNANLSYGLQLQDAGFLPATLVANNAAWGNPTSLGGMVQTMFGNVAMTTRPFTNADARLSYTIDERQPNTPRRNQIYGDAADTNTYSIRSAVPMAWTKQTFAAEAGYRILPSTKATIGYNLRFVDRSEAIVHSSTENEFTAKLRTTFTPDVTGSLGYNHSIRQASAPDYSFIIHQFGPSDCSVGNCLAVPTYMASRVQDALAGRLNATLGQDATLGWVAKFTNNSYPNKDNPGNSSYPNQQFGVTSEYSASTGPDVTYRFGPGAEGHAFYTYQRTYREMNGQPNYSNVVATDTHTTGLSGSWQVTSDVKIGSDYVFSYGSEAISQSGIFYNQSNYPAGDSLPNVTSMLNSFKLHGEYEYVPGITLFLGYSFDRLVTSDWAAFGTVSNQVLTGDGNPSYAVHSVISSVSFKW